MGFSVKLISLRTSPNDSPLGAERPLATKEGIAPPDAMAAFLDLRRAAQDEGGGGGGSEDACSGSASDLFRSTCCSTWVSADVDSSGFEDFEVVESLCTLAVVGL